MKKSNRLWKVLSVLIMVLAIGGVAAPTTSASTAASLTPASSMSIPGMCQVTSPSPGEMNTLTAITSVPSPLGQGETMMWAVGSTRPVLGSPGQINTLVMLNKGGVWGVVPSPSYAGANYLTGVSGTSTHDVWAVGYLARYGQEQPIVMHYDGISWKFALYPDPTMSKSMPILGGIRLTGITALSTTEAVAVGYITTDYHGYRPYVLYYKGGYWKQMYFPAPEGSVRLMAISGKSNNDLWAIATQGEDNVPGTLSMLYRYDGANWMLMSKAEGNLFSLAVAPDRVYSVGHADIESREEGLALVHDKMKGETVRVKTFNKDLDNNTLLSVTAAGDNIFAVGYSGSLQSGKPVTPIALRYDGTMFLPVNAPSPTTLARFLGATVDHGVLWAVGDYAPKSYPGALLDSSKTLIEGTLCIADR